MCLFHIWALSQNLGSGNSELRISNPGCPGSSGHLHISRSGNWMKVKRGRGGDRLFRHLILPYPSLIQIKNQSWRTTTLLAEIIRWQSLVSITNTVQRSECHCWRSWWHRNCQLTINCWRVIEKQNHHFHLQNMIIFIIITIPFIKSWVAEWINRNNNKLPRRSETPVSTFLRSLHRKFEK